MFSFMAKSILKLSEIYVRFPFKMMLCVCLQTRPKENLRMFLEGEHVMKRLQFEASRISQNVYGPSSLFSDQTFCGTVSNVKQS